MKKINQLRTPTIANYLMGLFQR